MALGQSNSLAPDAAKAQTAVKNIFTALDKQPVIDRDSDSQTVLDRVDGHVEFKHVDFKYVGAYGLLACAGDAHTAAHTQVPDP